MGKISSSEYAIDYRLSRLRWKPRARLLMAYPVAMDTHPSLPPELWERTPPAIRAYIEMLEGQVQTLTSMVHTFQEQVRTLEERLNQTSRNSSRPPSSDPPSLNVPGALQGSAVGAVNRVTRARRVSWCRWKRSMRWSSSKPQQCRSCQAPLSGDDASPFRHQVIEIPPIKPVITEYQWHQVTCPACGETTRAPWPAGVPVAPMVPASTPRWRYVPGPIACRSARRGK